MAIRVRACHHSATFGSVVVPLFTNDSASPRFSPRRVINVQGLDSLVGNTKERPMDIQFAVAEESRKQGQRMTRQRLIDKRFLPFQRFRGAATRSGVFIECRICDFGKEFAGCAQSFRTPRIASVPWLAQDELAAIGAVS